jgi:L-fucose mutarotase
MLNGPLLHPDILRVLARSGHHSKVLIADGNYPALNKRGPRAELVSLQLVPDVPTVAQVFQAVLAAVRIDEVVTMGVDRRTDPDREVGFLRGRGLR